MESGRSRLVELTPPLFVRTGQCCDELGDQCIVGLTAQFESGTISNDGQTSSTVHFVVDIDALAGGSGPHTIGFGVNSADGGFGAGTAIYDNVTPADASDPCPGQTCDEVNDVCIP